MVAYKKFEFDNFIIDDDDDTVVVENIDSDSNINAFSSEIEPIVEIETKPEVEITPEPEPVVEVITFNEEEMNVAKMQAEQIGYDKGYQAKSEETENMTAGLLLELNNKLSELFSAQEKMQQKLEQDFMALNRAVLQKLLPELSEEHAIDILNRFLENNFANFRTEAKLSFFFNPEIAPSMQQQIAKLARVQDFEGKISLHKDATLSLADCRVEWENGGVSRSSDKLLEKVNNLLEEKPAEN